MSRTAMFRRQHAEIMELAKSMEQKLNPSALGADANEVRTMLATLAGKLNVHLSMEDKSLYPALMTSKSIELKNLAEAYISEMGGLADGFRKYKTRWANTQAIQADPKEFVRETKFIFSALGKRIEKENNELYQAVDKLG